MNLFKNFINFFSFESKSFNENETKQKKFAKSKASYLDISTSQYLSSINEQSDENDSFFDNNFGNNEYINNPIVFRAINLVKNTASSISLKAMESDLKTNKQYALNQNHPLSKLIESPNFSMHCSEFLEKTIYNLLAFGNVFFFRINYQNLPKEIIILDQSQISILTNKKTNVVYGYRIENFIDNNSSSKDYLIDQISGDCDIFHLKNCNGFSSNMGLYGPSSIAPIASYVRYHNNMISWNSSMIKNGARPSGAFFLKSDKDGNFQFLSEDQVSDLKAQIQIYSSPQNAGKPMIIQGPLEWKEFSIKPKDMDFFEADKLVTKHVGNVFGVPVQLLGESLGSNSQTNFLEAKKMLYEMTVVPLLNKIICSVFNNWICKFFNKKNSKSSKYFVTFDENEISVLSYKKDEKLKALKESDFMTINEKRKAMELEPIDGGDKFC